MTIQRQGPTLRARSPICAICFVAMLLCLLSGCVGEPTRQHGEFVARSITLSGVPYRYQVFLPATAAAGRKPPVIVFLHGAGEGGTDNHKQTEVGIGTHIRRHMDSFPAIVVFPQAASHSDWDWYAPLVLAQLEAVLREFDGDADRVSVTGLSIGGTGALHLVLSHPERFSALVPICGQLNARAPPLSPMSLDQADHYRAVARALKDVPIWIFHGSKDNFVPPETSRLLFSALREAAARDARYTEFPNADHNSWDAAYQRTPELWPWLFEQRRRH